MKKIGILSFLAIMIALLSVIGCGKPNDDPKPDDPNNPPVSTFKDSVVVEIHLLGLSDNVIISEAAGCVANPALKGGGTQKFFFENKRVYSLVFRDDDAKKLIGSKSQVWAYFTAMANGSAVTIHTVEPSPYFKDVVLQKGINKVEIEYYI